MNREQAENLAIQVLGWLANDPDQLGHFLNASGATVDDLRLRAQEPEFLGFVLDFMMLDDANILEFCRSSNQPTDAIERAKYVLSGDF